MDGGENVTGGSVLAKEHLRELPPDDGKNKAAQEVGRISG
jgi:hypothetical protein